MQRYLWDSKSSVGHTDRKQVPVMCTHTRTHIYMGCSYLMLYIRLSQMAGGLQQTQE